MNQIKMDHAELETLIDRINAIMPDFAEPILAHRDAFSVFQQNPHMVGAVEATDEAMERCVAAYDALAEGMNGIVKVMSEAESVSYDTENKYFEIFKNIASDDFVTTANLDNIEPIDLT